LGAEERHALWGSETFPPYFDPMLNDRRRSRVDADRSSSVALSMKYRNGADVEIHILWFEGERFTHSEPGAVHDRDEGPISDSGGRVAALIEDGEQLLRREDFSGEREPLVGWNLPPASSRKCTCGSHGDNLCRVYDTLQALTLYDKKTI
jgi:hypothetical protein